MSPLRVPGVGYDLVDLVRALHGEEGEQPVLVNKALRSGHVDHAASLAHAVLRRRLDAVLADDAHEEAYRESPFAGVEPEPLGRAAVEEDDLGRGGGDLAGRAVDVHGVNAAHVADVREELRVGDVGRQVRDPEGAVLLLGDVGALVLLEHRIAEVVGGDAGRRRLRHMRLGGSSLARQGDARLQLAQIVPNVLHARDTELVLKDLLARLTVSILTGLGVCRRCRACGGSDAVRVVEIAYLRVVESSPGWLSRLRVVVPVNGAGEVSPGRLNRFRAVGVFGAGEASPGLLNWTEAVEDLRAVLVGTGTDAVWLVEIFRAAGDETGGERGPGVFGAALSKDVGIASCVHGLAHGLEIAVSVNDMPGMNASRADILCKHAVAGPSDSLSVVVDSTQPILIVFEVFVNSSESSAAFFSLRSENYGLSDGKVARGGRVSASIRACACWRRVCETVCIDRVLIRTRGAGSRWERTDRKTEHEWFFIRLLLLQVVG